MKIIADENIALASDAFSGFGEVELYPGRKITNEILKNADALVIRSITNVNEKLLKNTKVGFVGTATIGWDHLDTEYLDRTGIKYSSAAGCNSDAVAEYVTSALFDIAVKHKISLKDKKIGIIGTGNIGSRVARIAAAAGMNVLLNDPPLAKKTGSSKYLPLHELFKCDIITLHVPLNMTGKFKTFHLFDEENLSLLKDHTIFFNTSRGPVVDNNALLNIIKRKNLITILDVWEHEPKINKELLSLTEIATPHIAGYSFEGKINGTKMIYDELCRFAGFIPGWKYSPQDIPELIELKKEGSFEERINGVIKNIYDIRTDDADLRKISGISDDEIPHYFDNLRKNYKLRREFFNYTVTSDEPDLQAAKAFEAMRFK
ncbi:MAG: 4-phosphoerythronate dehydrogenase [Ignavibacteriales bacterium]|nr:MAG: 4-phosphoerythronate dehydrogenase [Ignavibacteriales bacterium]